MSDVVKIVVFVPETHAGSVRQAMGDVGAGQLGTYTHCTFSLKGTGRFIPQEGSDPHDGDIGVMNVVEEVRVEADCDRSQLNEVVAAVKDAHPYEEVPIDVYQKEDI
jgi:hypothetical protein